MRSKTAALALVFFGCGGAATPRPHAVDISAPPPPSVDTMPRGPQADALRWMTSTLEGAGHACHMAGDTLVCDDKKEGVPTLAVAWGNEPSLGPYVAYVASFNWKEASGCANAAKQLNALNSKFDLLRSSCTDENLIFALTIPIGERGMTAADVKASTTYFQGLVGAVLRSSDLLPLLK